MPNMTTSALLLALSATLWSHTSAFETDTLTSLTSHCTTQYLSSGSSEYNSTYSTIAPVYPPWVSTESYTTTAYSNYMKTEVLTPRASTTTLTSTSTSTAYETIRDTSTISIFTTTEYNTYTITQTEAVTSTTTVTVSTPDAVTISTPAGYIAVASANVGAVLKEPEPDVNAHWDVEDVWWTEYDQPIYLYDSMARPIATSTVSPLMISEPVPTLLGRDVDVAFNRRLRIPYRPQVTDEAQKVICTYTVQSNYFVTTTTIKRSSATTPTYTRTVYATTTTSTSTVRAKPTNGWNGTVSTEYPNWAYWNTTTSYTTLTTTDVVTVSTMMDAAAKTLLR